MSRSWDIYCEIYRINAMKARLPYPSEKASALSGYCGRLAKMLINKGIQAGDDLIMRRHGEVGDLLCGDPLLS